MNEELEAKYSGLTPHDMHDFNLAELDHSAGPIPESPASEMLVTASRIALSTQAVATEAMSCAAFVAAYVSQPPRHANISEHVQEAYTQAARSQQLAALVSNKFADLTHTLRTSCLKSGAALAGIAKADVRQMDEWHDQAAAASKRAAASIGSVLALMGIVTEETK